MSDDRTPDDDADTPRYRAPTVEERPMRRGWGSDRRALEGFRAKDTGPIDCIPEQTGPENEISRPSRAIESDPVLRTIWQHVDASAKRSADLVAEVNQQLVSLREHGIVAHHVAPEKTGPLKRIGMSALTTIFALVVGGMGRLVYNTYEAARERTAELHDQVLLLEQRVGELERERGIHPIAPFFEAGTRKVTP